MLVSDLTRSWHENFGANEGANHIKGSEADRIGFVPERGNYGANVGFTDGHVEWRGLGQLGQLQIGRTGSQSGYRWVQCSSANGRFWW